MSAHARLTGLELLALLYVPIYAAYDTTPFSIAEALAALAKSEALIADERRHKEYESARLQFLRGLAYLSRMPGGVTFGRLHFGGP